MASTPKTPEQQQKDPETYFQYYWGYATTWRNWVIGIAAGALFILLNKEVGASFHCRALAGR